MNMNLTEQQLEIRDLLREKDAILLAHYYQRGEIQDIADILGDSLALSMEAARTEARVLVFAGVHFMAESASILSPDKTVLLPKPDAGCPLADTIAPEALLAAKQDHPRTAVVTYINSSAAIKALSDVCCTSANADKVVSSLPADATILFVPDRHLGAYVARITGRNLILYPGGCPTHARIAPADIEAARAAHPGAIVIAHPECRAEVLAVADVVLSTSGMCRFAQESPAGDFIVATEKTMLYRLRKENPAKRFFPASEQAVCPNMKRITLEKVLWALEEGKEVVTVPEETRLLALRAVERMIAT